MTIVGLDLYSASTITVRYDVSWIIHVDKQLPFVAKQGIIYARHVVASRHLLNLRPQNSGGLLPHAFALVKINDKSKGMVNIFKFVWINVYMTICVPKCSEFLNSKFEIFFLVSVPPFFDISKFTKKLKFK
jgi:hypothetical protein